MKTLPTKLSHLKDDNPFAGLVNKSNEIIDFLDYFIRETEKCCTCNGVCPRHGNKDEIEEADNRKSLADKFKDFRSKAKSGKGDKYWSGLEKIAKEHYSSNW